MKTVLIVEDEKLIRQGLRTMIQRSGVPVAVILECNNGETALDILKEQEIDVMFTDIRMPKMDGIELVQRMQECAHVPLVVAVSGYDDFNYAVEMLRKGVREYLLKPVERARITEILQKLEQELNSEKEKEAAIRKIGYQQMKYLMTNAQTTEDELAAMEAQYGAGFFSGAYYVCCRNETLQEWEAQDGILCMKQIEGQELFIVGQEELSRVCERELSGCAAGVSGAHTGIGQLREAYLEASAMRRYAFCHSIALARHGALKQMHIPPQMLLEAAKLLEPGARLRRVQLLGTERSDELADVWKRFFQETAGGRISPDDFLECMQDFFAQTVRTYKNAEGMCMAQLPLYENIWNFADLQQYMHAFMEWLLLLNREISGHFGDDKSSQKMRQAVEYIEQNYRKDINMAVVSNYLSVNYSLFSIQFKQYTGCNFVTYVRNVRMREAKRLLAETDLKIVEISRMVGYENDKHFLKMFRADCGVSPGEYRKNVQWAGRRQE